MVFYFTNKSIYELKKSIIIPKKWKLIDIDDILNTLGYDITQINKYSEFILNRDIEQRILTAIKSSKIHSVVFSNPYYKNDSVYNIVKIVQNHNKKIKCNLLTNRDILEDLYLFFNKIVFLNES
jgi:hypothetical protein